MGKVSKKGQYGDVRIACRTSEGRVMDFDENRKEELKQHYRSRGIAIGTVLFMPFGVILWLLLDNPGFLGVGPALGISIGIAIGEAMYRKEVLGE